MTFDDQISAIMSQYGEELLAIGERYSATIKHLQSLEKVSLPPLSKACERAKNEVNLLAHAARKKIDLLHETIVAEQCTAPRDEAVAALVSASHIAKRAKNKKIAKAAHTGNCNG